MPGALEQEGWHAGSPEVRARDLQAAFADPEIDAIQTMRGGYGSAQLIPLLDFDLIAETPKAFVGSSDITALHVALLARAGLATFYGPSLTMFGASSTSSTRSAPRGTPTSTARSSSSRSAIRIEL